MEPDAGAASVLIDELDAARIQRRVNLSHRFARPPDFPSAGVARGASALNELGSFCKGVGGK